jgi:mannose-1-phosphate guanylyltransferase
MDYSSLNRPSSKMMHVILCGGAGTRLWPLSNKKTPKQLLQLFNGESLLQLCAKRNVGFTDSILAIASAAHADDVATQIQIVLPTTPFQLLAEPIGRNTAAAIALAALSTDSEQILLVTPADQLIGTHDLYAKAMEEAIKLAQKGNLVTFGLRPIFPETGFGYIQYANNEVIRFAEKPSLETAKSFIASGDYLWNSGIFCFKAKVILEELQQYAPDIYHTALVAFEDYNRTGVLSKSLMEAIPSNSIDYAVMEKSKNVKVVATDIEWSDVGSYESLVDALVSKYSHYNANSFSVNTGNNNNVVIGDEKLIAIVGIDDLIVVNTPTSILIMKKGNGQEIKKLHNWVSENIIFCKI